MSDGRFEWKPPTDLRFATTEYVVDASHEESHEIWYKYHMLYGVKFEQDNMGYCETIGVIAGRPISVTVFWHILEDLFRVAFVSGTSQLVDYQMVDDWNRQMFRCLNDPAISYNRRARSGGFMKVPADIERRLGTKVLRRGYRAVENVLNERLPLR